MGRRLAGVSLDWLACYFIVVGFSGGFGAKSSARPMEVLALFIFEYALLVLLQGQSLGHRLMRLKVVSYSADTPLSLKQVFVRTLLLVLVVTAVTYDENGRGIHERLSGTATIRY